MIAYRWQSKADDALAAARLLLREDFHGQAASQAYYAMHYAARSILELLVPGTGATKTHSGVIALLALHAVKEGKVSAEVGKLLGSAHRTRLLTDYDLDAVTRDLAKSTIADAEIFVTTMRAIAVALPANGEDEWHPDS